MRRGSSCRRFLAWLMFLSSLQVARVQAQPVSSPYRALVSLQGFYELKEISKGSGEREIIPTVRLVGRLRTEGRIDARFFLRKNKTWTSTLQRGGTEVRDHTAPILLQGKLALGGGYRRQGKRIMPGAASVIGRELKVSFPGRAKGAAHSRQRMYTIKVSLRGAMTVAAHVASIPNNAFHRGACAAPVGVSMPIVRPVTREGPRVMAAASKTLAGTSAAGLKRVITISTDADPEWYALFGENSNAEIASIVNAAEVIYDRQLGVRFRVVKQHVYTDSSPYTTTNSGDLLTAFIGNPDNAENLVRPTGVLNAEVDLKHLFTGKNLDGSVLGIAYVGVVCAAPRYAYGLTQSYVPAANMAIFAHEVGHNLGAFHDTSSMDGLMYPSIRVPPASSFSEASLRQINDHLDTFGSCVAVEKVGGIVSPAPDWTPGAVPHTPELEGGQVSIYVKSIGTSRSPVVRVYGRLRAPDRTTIQGENVYLMTNEKLLAAAVTDEMGRYQFFVRVATKRTARLGVYVQSELPEVRTKALYLPRTVATKTKR